MPPRTRAGHVTVGRFARAARVALVSRAMILNFVAQHTLGLRKSS